MKKQNQYLRNRRLSYQIAGILLIVATVGFTFTYFYQKNILQREEAKQSAEAEEESTAASQTVEPNRSSVNTDTLQKDSSVTEESGNDSAILEQEVLDQVAQASAITLHFPEELEWPVDGKVLLDYSMNQTVYFQTLQQYQYNPAVIIGASVNDPVVSAAQGKITSIINDAKTGTTITMDIGDGYQAVYGQLKEIPVATGEYVAKGQCIGSVSYTHLTLPTKA